MASGIGKIVVRIPGNIKAGDVVEIKALIRHPMETGRRKDKKTGKKVPAHYIDKVEATFQKEGVMTADWGAAIAKDPMIAFFLRVDSSGPLTITWKDNQGGVFTATKQISVQ